MVAGRGCEFGGEVDDALLLAVFDGEAAAGVGGGQGDDEGANGGGGEWGVTVGDEVPALGGCEGVEQGVEWEVKKVRVWRGRRTRTRGHHNKCNQCIQYTYNVHI